jgi:hypothetical protein
MRGFVVARLRDMTGYTAMTANENIRSRWASRQTEQASMNVEGFAPGDSLRKLMKIT